VYTGSQAICFLLARHVASRLRTFLWVLALPRAQRLCANIVALLQILPTFHVAYRCAANCRTLHAAIDMASYLGTNHCAIWFLTLHVAALSIETLASCLAAGCVALRATMLLTRWRLARPFAQWMASFLLFGFASLLHPAAICFVRSFALEFASLAYGHRLNLGCFCFCFFSIY